MPDDSTEQRKLAAIMFTDMVGYSATVQRNERLALELLEEHRSVLRGLFPRFNGTEIKTIGDAFLAEFSSALEAAQCAIEIQRTLAKRNADAPAGRQIQIRIGIHIGDVVHRGSDVYGDGVNIASRIEPLAAAGGICISVDVERQIRNTIEVGLVKLDSAELKNIQKPMDLFRIVLPWDLQTAKGQTPATPRSRPQSKIILAAATLVILIIAVAVWFLNHSKESSSDSSSATNSISATAFANPGKIQSLAVKPLDDFSGDTNQAYLSDGMTEALCAALGNISALRVPGRSSVMRYKGGQKSIQEMARELNVDAIVEGSIQRAGTRMLVTVKLVEAATDRHLWATNYQRDLSEFFKVQSEAASAIAAEVQVRLTPEDQARLARARVANRDAIEACLLGMHHWWQWSDQGLTNALRYFQKAVEIDPSYAPAHAGSALAYGMASLWWLWPTREAMPKSKQAAQRAIEIDPMLADSYVAMGYVRLLYDWDWGGAEKDFKRAIELSPNSSAALDGYANFLVSQRRFDEAVVILKKALELEPLSPALYTDLGWAYLVSGQFDRATEVLHKALELDRHFFQAHFWLGWNYELMGKPTQALTEFQFMLQLDPDSPVARMVVGYALGAAGRRAEVVEVLADLDQLAKIRYVTPYAQTTVYSGWGLKDVSLDWLEKCHDERNSWMPFLNVEPGLKPLRNEPRFQALLKKVGLDK